MKNDRKEMINAYQKEVFNKKIKKVFIFLCTLSY
jgi:hypothetical protein